MRTLVFSSSQALPRALQRGLVFSWLVVLHSACSSLEGPDYGVYDTSEGLNRASYTFSDRLDRAVVVPVAEGYQALLPDFVETAVTNFFHNQPKTSPLSSGRVFNVVADGVSDLSLRRADYNSIIKREGYDALIQQVEANIVEYGGRQ